MKAKKDWELFNEKTQAIVYGLHLTAIQSMLDFDFVCQRKPSVAAVVNPTGSTYIFPFFGKDQIKIPVYNSIEKAWKHHPKTEVFLNLASFRSAYRVTLEALQKTDLKIIVIVAEGIPENQVRELIVIAKKKKRIIIGPATVGAIAAGRFKVGYTCGDIDNIIENRLYLPGSVGLVSKSGGMLNELCHIVYQFADGINEAVAIGGDNFLGSTFLDHLLRFEKNPEIKILVMLGELGSGDELEVAKALKEGKIKKPLIAWVSGSVAKLFPAEAQFGHAGAKSGEKENSAEFKMKKLKEAGAIVPKSFDSFGKEIQKVYRKLVKMGKITKKKFTKEIPQIPLNLKEALEKGIVRVEKHFVSTISDDRGDEVKYLGDKLTDLLEKKSTIGEIVARLWFKKKNLPKYFSKFIELVLITVADHGPAVSGAHNAIVAARAGKDLISSLASGLLTIGPRFGGAINEAAIYFKRAKDSGKTPQEFVEEMKSKNIYIPGIGHLVKSLQNPDKRVEILKDFAKKNLKKTDYLDFALEVEKITTKKKSNLILNVDGAIGVIFLDLLKNANFKDEEIEEILETETLNALFALGRSIGILGHVIDQKRLKQPLYRVPQEDILYLKDY